MVNQWIERLMKTQFRQIILALVLLLPFPSYGAEVSWWKLDENTGTAANDSIGANHGTLTNGPSWVGGKVNRAVSFTAASSHYIQISATHVITTDDWSIFAWVRITTPSASSRWIYASGDTVAANLSGMNLRVETGDTLRCRAYVGTNSVETVTSTATIPEDGTWTHVGCIKSGTSLKSYINKVEDGSTTLSTATMDYTGDGGQVNTRIGEAQDTSGDSFEGVIDEVHLYDAAIDQATIDALYYYSARRAVALIF